MTTNPERLTGRPAMEDGLPGLALAIFEIPPTKAERKALAGEAYFVLEVSALDATPDTPDPPDNLCHVGPSRKGGILAFEAIAKGTQLIGFDLADLRASFGGKLVSVRQIWASRDASGQELAELIKPHLEPPASSGLLAFHLPESFEKPLFLVDETVNGLELTEFGELFYFFSYPSHHEDQIGMTIINTEKKF